MKEEEEMDLFYVGKDQAWILMHFDAQVEIYSSMEHDLDEEERFRWAKNLHFVPGAYFDGDTESKNEVYVWRQWASVMANRGGHGISSADGSDDDEDTACVEVDEEGGLPYKPTIDEFIDMIEESGATEDLPTFSVDDAPSRKKKKQQQKMLVIW